jgi:hypothetical protein
MLNPQVSAQFSEHHEPVNVISKLHQNRPTFSMTAVITTAKDGRLGADT